MRSPNPSGRSPGFAGVAKMILAETDDGAELVEWALEVWRDPSRTHAERRDAHEWLALRALGKPIAIHELSAEVRRLETPEFELPPLKPAQLAAMRALLENSQQPALPAASDDQLTDGE